METTKTLARELPLVTATGPAMSGTPSLDRIDVGDPARVSGAVQTIDFHGLTRSVQERFVACIHGRQAPKPIAEAKIRSYATVIWTLVIAIAAAALALLVAIGFGNPYSAEGLHRLPRLVIYFLALTTIVVGIVQIVVRRTYVKSLPWDRGLYVFPVSLVDAREALIQVFSLADVRAVERDAKDPSTLRIAFVTGEVFSFPVTDADATMARLEGARHEARELRSSDDPRITWMFAVDPLQQPRVSSLLGPRNDLARHLPWWTGKAYLIAPVIALLLAVPLRTLRNKASDAKMYSAAVAANDPPSFRAYVSQGGARSDEVTRVLLPRAELRAAAQVGTVEAIDQYMAAHPNSAIADEVAAARRKALLDELERAKKVGTVAAIQDFAKKWPDHGLDVEIRAAIHELFAPALEKYRKQKPGNPQVRAFAEQLFAWSEAKAHAGTNATTIQIRFRRKPSPTMHKADKMVAEHHWFIGEASYPSRYFDTNHSAARETALGERLGKRVREAFGPSVFTVEQGARLDDNADALPVVTEPTIFITHEESWGGLFDGSITKPRGIWIDTVHKMDAVFVIPGHDVPLRFEFETKETIPPQVIKDNPQGGTQAAPLEDKIYDAMVNAAFAKFEEKYLALLLAR